MPARCYEPSPQEIRRHLHEAMFATRRLIAALPPRYDDLKPLHLIHTQITSAICNVELAIAVLQPQEDRP